MLFIIFLEIGMSNHHHVDSHDFRQIQARRAPQRGPGNHYRGALTQPHSVCAEIESRDAEGVEREETWGGVSPRDRD